MDRRQRVLAMRQETGPSAWTAARYKVGEARVRRLTQAHRATGSIAPRPSARKTSARRYDDDDKDDEAATRNRVADQPDVTPAEDAAPPGKPAGLATVHRSIGPPWPTGKAGR